MSSRADSEAGDNAGPLSLAVTSSTAVVGVAIGHAGSADGVTFDQVLTDRRHAEELTPLVERVLDRAGVGLATVRTLALAVDKPVIGLTSLEILAGLDPDRPLTAVIDARRGEVFQQRFEADGTVAPAAVLTPDDGARAAVRSCVVGDGADRYADLYGAGVRFGRVPSAAVMIKLAAGRSASPGVEAQPVYLRDPDVNVNVKTRHTPR